MSNLSPRGSFRLDYPARGFRDKAVVLMHFQSISQQIDHCDPSRASDFSFLSFLSLRHLFNTNNLTPPIEHNADRQSESG